MEPGLTPVAVPTRGPSARMVLVALGAGLALIVGVGVLGKSTDTSLPASPLPAAIAPAAPGATPTLSLTPSPTPQASERTAPSSAPPTEAPLVPRSGPAKVSRGVVAVHVEPRALIPTGIETLSAPGPYSGAVVDGKGIVWAYAYGALTRYDPAVGSGHTWTASDDARFVASAGIAPAREGGVWLAASSTVRRFDGSGFPSAIDIGSDVTALTEGPDGSLWAATQDGFVVHVAGAKQTRIDALRPSADASITTLAVDRSGGIWCGWASWAASSSVSWVARYDGSSWRAFDARDTAPLGSNVTAITPFPDGSTWFATDKGLARFDGTGWTDLATITATPPVRVTSVSPGPDGVPWIASADLANAVSVARLDGASWTNWGSWTMWGPDDGLPGPDATGTWLDATGTWLADAWIVSAKGRILVAAKDGLYGWSGGSGRSRGRWSRVWPGPGQAGPGEARQVLAVSHDEAWVSEGGTVWHFLDGAWSGPSAIAASGGVSDLLRTPDGSVWAASGDGLYRSTGSTWRQVSTSPTASLALGRDGVVRVAVDGGLGGLGVVVDSYYLDGRTWREGASTAPTNLVASPARLAVGRDGTIWVGTIASWGWKLGLVRYVNGGWEMVYPDGGKAPVAVSSLTVAPNGDIWMVGQAVDTADNTRSFGPSWIRRFDGTRWTLPGEATWLSQDTWSTGIAAAADGTIWAMAQGGLARFDGTRWTRFYETLSFSAISVAPDGTVWANGPSGVVRLPAP